MTKTDEPEAQQSRKQMLEQDALIAQITRMLDFTDKNSGKVPLLTLADTDAVTVEFLQEMAHRWDYYKEPAPDVYNIAKFLLDFITCWRYIENDNQRNHVLDFVRNYHVVAQGCSISGVNRYDADKSRVDGRLIKRKR